MTITDIRGVPTWIEQRGTGDPVLLLHGGFGHSGEYESSLWALADAFRVIAYDRRGHGRTPDIGEWTRAILVGDCAAVIEAAADTPVHVVGYSDGGLVAAGVASARPELVRSLTLVSTALQPSGWIALPPEPDPADPTAGFPPQVLDAYTALSPDGLQNFPNVVRKASALAREEPDRADALAVYPGRVLVIAADDDIVTLESQLALYRTLQKGELAIIPGTSHDSPREKPHFVTLLVRQFLTEQPLATHIPIHRAG